MITVSGCSPLFFAFLFKIILAAGFVLHDSAPSSASSYAFLPQWLFFRLWMFNASTRALFPIRRKGRGGDAGAGAGGSLEKGGLPPGAG
jgi:hypothetical protein